MVAVMVVVIFADDIVVVVVVVVVFDVVGAVLVGVDIIYPSWNFARF